MNWLTNHWPTILSLIFGGGGLTALVKYAPTILRRFALMLDCELDRLRWEEADRLRNGEIKLLRQDVQNLQGDIGRLQARLVASGAVSGGATESAP